MRWPWRRQPDRPLEPNHVDRLPDGDRVLRPGEPRWADLVRPEAGPVHGEVTQPLPLLAPLMTPGAWWRTRRGQR